MSRILIIEDHSNLLHNLERGLTLLKHDVLTAETGEDGLPIAMTQPVDIVVLDLMLPGKNGFEVLRDLRQAGFAKPILILSARDAPDDRRLGRELGADGFVIKPFAFSDLMARINALLDPSAERTSIDEDPPCAG